jgi:hypothetical protein
MNKLLSIALVSSIVILFSACGTGPQIVIPSYTAPKEAAKLSKIETKDEFISKGAYLALWLNPEVKGAQTVNKKLTSMLINSVKAKLTETNFIAIDPLGGEDGVALNMSVASYNYELKDTKVSFYTEIVFTLSRGVDDFLVKKYRDRKNRQSSDISKLPSENELASAAVDKIVKYFISDISPLKTNQLREFKSFPSELEAVVTYAKRKNYKGAIKLMNRYKGEKDMSYCYNLAVLYEAEASVTENLELLDRAQFNYELAMRNGGNSDDVVNKANAKFESFYELLNKTKKQDQVNQALVNDRNSMAGSSDDEYE